MHIISNSAVKKLAHPAILASGLVLLATPAHAADWINAGTSLEGDAKIELNKTFSKKAGNFKAIPESVVDKKKSITGSFVVGTYRYIYSTPQQEGEYRVDETVFKELMDCKNNYYGTLQQIKKFRGQVVLAKQFADTEVVMMQTSQPTIDAQLCQLHAAISSTPVGRNQVKNPDYRPGAITEAQADALIDKYAPRTIKK
jgi:hypothetical protein